MSSPSLAALGLTMRDVVYRALLKCRLDKATGCWHWGGYVNPQGYGIAKFGQTNIPAHRAVYEATYGPIADGLTVDHQCHNRDTSCAGGPTCLHRRCVNPKHLEAVTQTLNTLRSVNTAPGANIRKEQCKRGHPFDEVNTYWMPNQPGGRQCRACKAMLNSAARVRARARTTREPIDRAA